MRLRWLPIALCLTALALATSSGADVVRDGHDCAGTGAAVDPSIAFDGTNFLVAWTSGQIRRSDLVSSGVCATRVSRAGAVRDPGGLTITPATPATLNFTRHPSVAFGDRNHLVVWMDQRSGLDGDVYGSRVGPRGGVLDEPGLRLTTSSGYLDTHPSLAFDGTNYLVVWEHQVDFRGDNVEIRGVLVSSTGDVLRNVRISTRHDHQLDPVVAFDGANFLVVWKRGCAGICGARVSPSGIVLDGAGIPISEFPIASHATVAVAFDGTNYLVVWDGSRPEITFTRVSPAGNVLDPDPIAIGRGRSPAVTFAGSNYLIAWLHTRDVQRVFVVRVSPSGTVLDPAGIRISNWSAALAAPAVAFDGTNALVVWSAGAYSTPRIFGARVSAAGRVLDANPILISTPPIRCVVPRVVGLQLARAKARIRSANCRVGHLRRRRSSRVGRVLAQSPRAGVRRPRGTRVNLVVGARRR